MITIPRVTNRQYYDFHDMPHPDMFFPSFVASKRIQDFENTIMTNKVSIQSICCKKPERIKRWDEDPIQSLCSVKGCKRDCSENLYIPGVEVIPEKRGYRELKWIRICAYHNCLLYKEYHLKTQKRLKLQLESYNRFIND